MRRRAGLPRSRFYAAALEAYVARLSEGDVTETLDRVYADVSSDLDPALARAQSASLSREDW